MGIRFPQIPQMPRPRAEESYQTGSQAHQDFLRMLQQQQEMEGRLITEGGRSRAQGIRESGRIRAEEAAAPYQAIGNVARTAGDVVSKIPGQRRQTRMDEAKIASEEGRAADALAGRKLQEEQLAQSKANRKEDVTFRGEQADIAAADRTRRISREESGGRVTALASKMSNAFQSGIPFQQVMQEIEMTPGVTPAEIQLATQQAGQTSMTSGIMGQQAQMMKAGYGEMQDLKGTIRNAGSTLSQLNEQIDQYEQIDKEPGKAPAWIWESGSQQKIKERMAGMLKTLPGGQAYADEIVGTPMELHTSIGKMKEAVNAISGNLLAQIKSGEAGLTEEWRQDPEMVTALANIQNIAGKNLEGTEYQMVPKQAFGNQESAKAARAKAAPQNFMQWTGTSGGSPMGPQTSDQARIMNTSTLRGGR